MRPSDPNLLGQLDRDAYVVEIAALLDVLGIEHDTVRLGIARDKAALFAADLRTGQAARGLGRSAAREALLPGHIEATIRACPGIDLRLTGRMARRVAQDLEVGRRLRLGLPVLRSAARPALAGQDRPERKPRSGGASFQA